jgi:nitroreductase
MQTKVISSTLPVPETIDIIYSRRAVRKYKNKPVERRLIEKVIDAGRMAPSAVNKQPWRFYVLTDKTTIHEFSEAIGAIAMKSFAKKGFKAMFKVASQLLHFSHGIHFHGLNSEVFHGAPVVVFITAPRDNEWASLDIGMCSQNMMLAAKSLGLDSCPVGFGKFVEKTKIFPKLMVPKSDQVMLSIVFGYGDEKPELHERKKDNIVYID